MMQSYQKFFLHYFNLKQTTGRKDYWLATLVNLIFAIIFYAVFSFFFYLLGMTDEMLILNLLVAFVLMILAIIATAFVLAILIPSFTLSFRRYRDTGLSLWFFGIEVLAVLAFLWLLSGELKEGYTSIWPVLVTTLLVVADILVKLLPSAGQNVGD